MSEFSQLPIHPHIQRVAERGREPHRFQPTSGRIPGATQERLSLLDRWQARYGIGEDTAVAEADLTYTNPTPQPPVEPNHPLSEVARSIAIAKSTAPDSPPPGESRPPQTFRVSRKAMSPDAVVPKSATATDSPQTSSLAAPGETPSVSRPTTSRSAIQPPGKPTPLSRLLRLRSVQVRSIQAESFPPPQPSAPPAQAAVNPQSASFSQQRERSPQTPPATPHPDASVQALTPTTHPQFPTNFPIARAKPIPVGNTPKAGFIQRASSRSTPSAQQPPTHHFGDKQPVAKGKVTGTRAEIPLSRLRSIQVANSLQRNRVPLRLSSATTSQSPASPAASVPTASPSPPGEPLARENVAGVSAETALATAPTAYPLQRTTQEKTIPVARAVAVSSQPPSVQRQPDRSLTVPNSPGHLPSSVSRALATAAPPHQQDAEHSSASDREVHSPSPVADAVPTPLTAAAPEMVWRKSAITSPEPAFSRPLTPENGHSPSPIVQTAPAQSSQTRETDSPPTPGMTATPPSPSVNVAQLAEQVSRILYRQLRVERERRGMSP